MTHPSFSRSIVKMRPNKSPKRVRFGYPWIYSDEVVLDRRTKKTPPGTIVEVHAPDGEVLGIAAFHPDSKITLRMLDRDANANVDVAWLTQKVKTALALRERLYDAPYYRLIHAEADGLPGVVADRFGDVISVQPNAAWADQMFDELAEALMAATGASTIFKNASGRTRKLEGLDDQSGVHHGLIAAPVVVPMNGALYMADLLEGQKTGLFFDQRDNHAFAARLAKDCDVLDVFSHVGGFSLAALAAGAKSAIAVDGSQQALTLAAEGAEKMGVSKLFATQKGDAFSEMQTLIDGGRTFEVVICDPPAFAPAKPALAAGLRAYERVARLAAQLAAPGGFVGLCSCSHAASPAMFREASLRGIGKSGRAAQILHQGTAGADHPEHAQLAESAYLKSLFVRLD